MIPLGHETETNRRIEVAWVETGELLVTGLSVQGLTCVVDQVLAAALGKQPELVRAVVLGGGWNLTSAWQPYEARLSLAARAPDAELLGGAVAYLTDVVRARDTRWTHPTLTEPRLVVVIGDVTPWRTATSDVTAWFPDHGDIELVAALAALTEHGPSVGVHVLSVGRVVGTQLWWVGDVRRAGLAADATVRTLGQNIGADEALFAAGEDGWARCSLSRAQTGPLPPTGDIPARPALLSATDALAAFASGAGPLARLAVEAARWQYRFPSACSDSAVMHYLRLCAIEDVPSEWASAFLGITEGVSS